MKQYIKHALSLFLCVGLLQPQLQAGPVQDFCRKWVSRTVALVYWTLLTAPAVSAVGGWDTLKNFQQHLRGVNVYNTPQYADFKNKYPQKYTEVQNVLLHEGLEGLDRYTIKVLTSSEYDTAHIGQNNVVSAGNKLLVLPSSLDGVALSRVDGELLAAILEHEMTHDAEDHTLKKLLVAATTPFAMHAAAKGIYNNIVSTAPKPGSYPTMTRSLLRIPRVYAILNMAPFVQSWYTRRCEREADAGVGSSPRLALKLAEYFKKTHLPHEIIENADENTSALRKQLNKMLDTHPLSSERIAYLERWAAEAEEKKKQE